MINSRISNFVSVLLISVGLLTGSQYGHNSFYEGEIHKVDMSKKISGHEGQWSKQKRES